MWKTIVTTLVIFGGAVGLSSAYIGYDHAGKYYLQKMTEQRKSVRAGSVYGTHRIGGTHSGGLRSGK